MISSRKSLFHPARFNLLRIEVFFFATIPLTILGAIRRIMAKFSAPFPSLVLCRSSFIVTSRTQCREFSIPQWDRTLDRNTDGAKASPSRKYRVSEVVLPLTMRSDSTGPMATRPGQSCRSGGFRCVHDPFQQHRGTWFFC